MVDITLCGDPKSTQHCYKYTCQGGFVRSYMDPVCKSLKEEYAWQARGQYHGPAMTGELIVTMHLYHRTRRKADIDNFNKLVLDALTGIVFEDDVQIVLLQISKNHDKESPRVELSIEELA